MYNTVICYLPGVWSSDAARGGLCSEAEQPEGGAGQLSALLLDT